MTLDNINDLDLQITTIPKPVIKKEKFNIKKELFMVSIIGMLGFVVSMLVINFGVVNAYYQIRFDNSSHEVPENIVINARVDIENKIQVADLPSNSNNGLLKQKKDKIGFVFNQLPPDNRLFIEGLDIQAPIIDVKYYTEEKLEKGDFMTELTQGVVKYPGTPDPGEKGNILIFGHTSNYARVKSDFNNIFSKITQMEAGNQIKLARNGKIYIYNVISKEIVKPKDLIAISEKNDDHYISLIGCYPIGDSSKRVVVIGKLQEVKNSQLAYNK